MKLGTFNAFIFVYILSISSCTGSKQPIGKWQDNIQLSAKKILLKETEDSTQITTEKEWWWISEINTDGKIYSNFEKDTSIAPYTISKEYITVTREDSKTLHIKTTANAKRTKRTVTITLQAGNYFDTITLIQKGI